MRALGRLGAPVYGVNNNDTDAELKSRYLKQYFVKTLDPEQPEDYLEFVIALAKVIGGKPVLIATSDELSVFVAQFKERLAQYFRFAANSLELIDSLADKAKMFHLALEHDVPTPHMASPANLEELKAALAEFNYPVMLKAIDGNKLFARTGKKMVIVQSEEELLEQYQLLEDPADPNLMVQELIPGEDDQVFIFNGYFNKSSDCLCCLHWP